jgi:hypothetical protein
MSYKCGGTGRQLPFSKPGNADRYPCAKQPVLVARTPTGPLMIAEPRND